MCVDLQVFFVLYFEVKMPKSCCVAGCTANAKKNENLKFFILPTDGLRRKRWLSFVGRAAMDAGGKVDHSKVWSPRSSHHYVCSQHFISGVF